MRAVLDVNVLVSALLSPTGAPARILASWLHGGFDLVASPQLLDELRRVLAYRKISRHVSADDAERYVHLLSEQAILVPDPDPNHEPPIRSPDPGDDYLIALAMAADALLVSGDAHLVSLMAEAPVQTPAQFAERLESL